MSNLRNYTGLDNFCQKHLRIQCARPSKKFPTVLRRVVCVKRFVHNIRSVGSLRHVFYTLTYFVDIGRSKSLHRYRHMPRNRHVLMWIVYAAYHIVRIAYSAGIQTLVVVGIVFTQCKSTSVSVQFVVYRNIPQPCLKRCPAVSFRFLPQQIENRRPADPRRQRPPLIGVGQGVDRLQADMVRSRMKQPGFQTVGPPEKHARRLPVYLRLAQTVYLG